MGRNDQIHHNTVNMQIVCFCFGCSFQIESTLEKMEVSNVCVCLGSNYVVSSSYVVSLQTMLAKRFYLTSGSASQISLESHRKFRENRKLTYALNFDVIG